MCQIQLDYHQKVPLQKNRDIQKPIHHRQSQEIKDHNLQQPHHLRQVNRQSQCPKFQGSDEIYHDVTV